MSLEDTIAAIATPLQPSGLGVIRVSGKQAVSMVGYLFKGNTEKLEKTKSNKLVHGWIHDNEKLIDRVLVIIMRSPRSYTTEDVVEIQCHGSPFIMQRILDLLLDQGARLAESGEFTQRAFLHGRIDLTQAEAVLDLVHSNSELGSELAVQQLKGKLYIEIEKVKKQVLATASLVEASIEFPEEDVEFVKHDECLRKIRQASSDLEKILVNANLGVRVREGFSVALIGRPNVGKSSLFNRLLNDQRAIVTNVPGTTRDYIEESKQIKGITFRLTDTAGIRNTKDLIESEGIRQTQNVLSRSDLVLLILDGGEKLNDEDLELIRDIKKNKTIIIINKIDLLTERRPVWTKEISGVESVLVSAKTGEGCDELESSLYDKATLDGIPNKDEIWITNRRQQQAAERALASLFHARQGLEQSKGEEFVAVDLRSCLNALGDVVGQTTPDDLLGHIFSEFCIGK
jgi:tRNA modification GTPase